ncbi:MAG: pantoate--beta-alanine ligase [bacterium]
MDVVESSRTIYKRVQEERSVGRSVGFVPTMGGLHRGHEELVQQSVDDNNVTVVSIFLNPAQFDSDADYEAYPASRDEDVQTVEQAGADYVFYPEYEEMYTEGDSTTVRVKSSLTERFEGEYKEQFFDGVTRILTKLFNIIPSSKAYFGEKDLQQLVVVKRMVEDLKFPHEIVPVPTVRDQYGVAYSSRNRRLKDRDWETVRSVYDIFQGIKDTEHTTITSELDQVRNQIEQVGMDLEYLALISYPDFTPTTFQDEDAVCIMAGRVGEVRIKDNLPIHVESVRQLEKNRNPVSEHA